MKFPMAPPAHWRAKEFPSTVSLSEDRSQHQTGRLRGRGFQSTTQADVATGLCGTHNWDRDEDVRSGRSPETQSLDTVGGGSLCLGQGEEGDQHLFLLLV